MRTLKLKNPAKWRRSAGLRGSSNGMFPCRFKGRLSRYVAGHSDGQYCWAGYGDEERVDSGFDMLYSKV
jgi:hypothetical protein